jgi:AraC family transcriptional regulator
MSDGQPLPEQHLHLIDSFAYGWRKLNLIYEREPRGEMPEAPIPGHMLVIAQGDFQSSIYREGIWHQVNYCAGDIAIVPSSELFPRTWIDREVPLLELFLDPKVLELAECLELEPQWQIRDPLIEQMGVALQQETIATGAAGEAYAEAIAIALSAHLARRYGKKYIVSPPGMLTAQQSQLVRDYICANLIEDLSVDRLARLLQLSPGHFAILFKRRVGITPHQYVVQVRIDRACLLLRSTDLPILAIAHQIGLHTQSHFTRLFRQRMGLTPKQYRDRYELDR